MSAPKKLTPYDILDQIEERARSIDDRQKRRNRLRTQATVTSLCASCKHSQIMRQRGAYFQIVHCGLLSQEVPPDLDECSAYAAQTSLSLLEMSQMAKIIESPRDTGGHYL